MLQSLILMSMMHLKRDETLVIALEDAYNRVDIKIFIRTLINMKIDPYVIMCIGKALLKRKSGSKSGTMDL